MFKKLLAIICTASLLSACASQKDGADLYGNGQGGWNDNVNISDLTDTAMTQKFKDENQNVVYFALNSSDLDSASKDVLSAQAEWLKANPEASDEEIILKARNIIANTKSTVNQNPDGDETKGRAFNEPEIALRICEGKLTEDEIEQWVRTKDYDIVGFKER